MAFDATTRRGALERAARDACQNGGRSAGVHRLTMEALADLWLKWANMLDEPLPCGAMGQEIYVKTSVGRQRRLVRRSQRERSGLEFYHGAGQSRVNGALLPMADEDLLDVLEKDAAAHAHEAAATSGDVEYARSVVTSVLKTQDQVRALCSRLDGEECEAIAMALSVPPARVRKWFSRDMPAAFERAGRGDLWRRLRPLLGMSR